MAVGNTFGATALSSYGGFWIAFGIIFTPGGFQIQSSLSQTAFLDTFSFFLFVCTSDHVHGHKPTNIDIGLVYFYLSYFDMHAAVYRCLFPAILHLGYGIPPARHWLC